MSATMPRQGGRIQQEQTNMCLALNMAEMAKVVWLRAAREEIQYWIMTSRAKVWEGMKSVLSILGIKK